MIRLGLMFDMVVKGLERFLGVIESGKVIGEN